MKPKEKRMILILLVILVIAIIIFAVNKNKKGDNNENTVEENKVVEEFVQVLEDGTKLNTSEKLNEAKMLDGLKFENMQLTNNNGQTVLLADVTNTTSKTTELTLVTVIVLDKNGNEIGKINGAISPLKASEKMQFNAGTTLDYANAYDFKVTKK